MSTENINYRPSIVARIARKTLPVLQKILPNKIYVLGNKFAYSTYKWILHKWYFVRVVVMHLLGNKIEKERHLLVWKTLPYSMGGHKALENAFDLTLRVEKLQLRGDIVECGVAKGGASAIMALVNRRYGQITRTKWLFDSFEGMPEASAEDYIDGKKGEYIRSLEKGECLGTLDEVSWLMFTKLEFRRDEVQLIKGWFQNSVPLFQNKIGEIAILRLDADWYESTRIPLENLYDKVVEGGFVIVDDYATCFGSRRAVDEFFQKRGIEAPLNEDGRGGVWFEKPKQNENGYG